MWANFLVPKYSQFGVWLNNLLMQVLIASMIILLLFTIKINNKVEKQN